MQFLFPVFLSPRACKLSTTSVSVYTHFNVYIIRSTPTGFPMMTMRKKHFCSLFIYAQGYRLASEFGPGERYCLCYFSGSDFSLTPNPFFLSLSLSWAMCGLFVYCYSLLYCNLIFQIYTESHVSFQASPPRLYKPRIPRMNNIQFNLEQFFPINPTLFTSRVSWILSVCEFNQCALVIVPWRRVYVYIAISNSNRHPCDYKMLIHETQSIEVTLKSKSYCSQNCANNRG